MSTNGLALILCALLTAVSTPASLAACFDDLSDHWAKSSATRLSDKGFIPAAPDGKFYPDQQITREDLSSWLERILETDRKEPVADETPDALKSDSTNGRRNFIRLTAKYFDTEEEGAIDPQAPVRRAEAFGALGRALGTKEPDEATIESQLANYPDGFQVPDWDKSGLTALCRAGIFVPSPGQNSINPGGLLTRAEAAVLLDRFDSYCLRGSIAAAVAIAEKNTPQQTQPDKPVGPASFRSASGVVTIDDASAEELIDVNDGSVIAGHLTENSTYSIFPIGTRFTITLNEGLDSAKDKRGDYRTGTTTAPTCINGAAVEEGAVFKGRLTSVVSAKRFFGSPGRIGIHFNELEIPALGRTFPVSARVDTSKTRLTGGEEGQRARQVAENATKGAMIGLLVGSLLGPAVGAAVGNGSRGWGGLLSNVTTQAACTGAGALVGAGMTKGVELKIPAGVTMDLVLDKPLEIPVQNLPPGEVLVFQQ